MDLGALRRHFKTRARLTRAWQEMEQITSAPSRAFASRRRRAGGGGWIFGYGARRHMAGARNRLGMNMSWQSVPRMLHLIGPARTKQR